MSLAARCGGGGNGVVWLSIHSGMGISRVGRNKGGVEGERGAAVAARWQRPRLALATGTSRFMLAKQTFLFCFVFLFCRALLRAVGTRGPRADCERPLLAGLAVSR